MSASRRSGLDICRSAAIKHGMCAAVFSLEMSRVEITMRLLSAEARVSLHEMRSGQPGTCTVTFQSHYSCFGDMTKEFG